jgi:transposase-like protein
MRYLRLKLSEFFGLVDTEEAARDLFWRAKFGGKEFECPRCFHEKFYAFTTRPEVRRCRQCDKQVRVRAGTMLEHSKKPLLVWTQVLFLMMQDKRGVSALHVQRELGLRSYGTVWGMLHKIRRALEQRDDIYKLNKQVELDGASFGREAPQRKGRRPKTVDGKGRPVTGVLIAVETKEWVDEKGRSKDRAGFAKVAVSRETTIFSQRFVESALAPGTTVKSDGSRSFNDLNGVDLHQQVMNAQPELLNRWLPWVHRFISNAKSWLIGTHHAVKAKYLRRYLAEYTYRFNRRHDPDGLFHRALTACALASPVRLCALSG